MNKKGVVLFDIDRSIFDTDKMSEVLYKNVLKILNTRDLEKVKRAKDDYKKTLKNQREYVPDEYIKLLCTRFKFKNPELLLNIYYGDDYKYIYEESVFLETFEVFEKLKSKYRIGIYSEGTKKFQNNKFKSMNLGRYVDNSLVYILGAKDNGRALIKIPKNSIIVDDKEHICEFLFKNGIKAIWLNKRNNHDNPNFVTIHNLLELPGILL